ncbi:KptA family-domain-containing protein [Mycena belliarum]|uniref:2'-phosphotransferase n=1 Tax=Mycena belliarum TaxID=1033014 RepID=A0AAD6U605_9AGAR|nr:KptA family-domain-containing protein [Mycena belliae]
MSLHRRLPYILRIPRQYHRRFLSTEGTWNPEHDAARYKFFSTRLNYLLRHAVVKEHLEIRPDGHVRLDDVRRSQLFRNIPSPEFDRMVQEVTTAGYYDRCQIKEDFDIRIGRETTWIRAGEKHSIPSLEINAQQIRSPKKLPMAVYSLDLQSWAHVARRGIPQSETDNFIHLIPTTPEENYVQGPGAQFDVCIYIDVAKTLAAGIKLFRMPAAGCVLTNGNLDGVLPPALFKKVVRVKLERQTILMQ